MTETRSFPKNFIWGAATASYQIEGAWDADGKSESIWDRFSHTSGNILHGHTGDVACDHYHLWRSDIQLMQEIGLKAYRFSISWPRLLPDGRGQVNQAGIDFYSRLVDALLEAGITPFATLYHWDLLQVLQDQGGWTERSTAEAFVEYTDVVTRYLGDRVKNWMTHNEPSVAAYLGYWWGNHAPGVKSRQASIQAIHHLLLSHGWAVPVIRQNSPGAEVGIVINISHTEPASPSQADAEAVRRMDGMWRRWLLDPLYGRGYPTDLLEDEIREGTLPAEGLFFVKEEDCQAISTPTDFLGLNYYTRHVVRSQDVPESENLPATVIPPPINENDYTEMGWEVYPRGLYYQLQRFALEYHPPKIYIAENGASYSDGPGADGRVHDARRIRYLKEHFAAAQQAIQEGVPLAGYFVWSLMDNFEWAYGFTQRFGLIWVDYETRQRILKDSALWYQQVIRENGLPVSG
ncbi:MAG: beta-glucosidase [Anaerolineales bacterium]|nr:beta-glucosidase [Anaerolineales bacterium]